jgi:membrane-associated protease RseP (regulator of RpoE activity)
VNEISSASGPPDLPTANPYGLPNDDAWVVSAPPRPKFQHRYRTHILLFLLTLATTTWAGTGHYASFQFSVGNLTAVRQALTWSGLFYGLWYSLPLLIILGAHELGHYIYCRIHNVDATLPYFIPAPFPLTGTFGAVIRIRETFPSKRALFDIGVAGPIAGFVLLLPFAYLGVSLSHVVRFPQGADLIYFGEPLLFKALEWLRFGALPPGYDTALHPMGFAAWWGMLATALNLMPFGQLDGGHIAYAVFGRRAQYVSMATLASVLLLTFASFSWISMTIMLLVMAFFLGVRHPHIADEDTPLDGRRRLVALFALVMFVLCFTPVPIETFIGK